jgi:hypothetical protein
MTAYPSFSFPRLEGMLIAFFPIDVTSRPSTNLLDPLLQLLPSLNPVAATFQITYRRNLAAALPSPLPSHPHDLLLHRHIQELAEV